MASTVDVKFGLVHETFAAPRLQRGYSLGCLREAEDLEALEVFEIVRDDVSDDVSAEERTTIKLRNFKGRYDLRKLMKDIVAYKPHISLVRLICPPNGRPYAYIVFQTAYAAAAFIEQVKAAAALKGKGVLTGGMGKRDAHYAKHQGEAEILACFPDNCDKRSNTWVQRARA